MVIHSTQLWSYRWCSIHNLLCSSTVNCGHSLSMRRQLRSPLSQMDLFCFHPPAAFDLSVSVYSNNSSQTVKQFPCQTAIGRVFSVSLTVQSRTPVVKRLVSHLAFLFFTYLLSRDVSQCCSMPYLVIWTVVSFWIGAMLSVVKKITRYPCVVFRDTKYTAQKQYNVSPDQCCW